jgi:luciferase family oxidoreductase group 1
MRRGRMGEDNFPAEVQELMGYLGETDPRAAVQAHPGQGTHVPLWILGSSLYGAQLAAHFGLPYAFASHFAPDALEDAVYIYRRDFKPSAALQTPKFMLAINVIGAETDVEAQYLRTSVQQAFARLRSGTPGKLPRPVDDIDAEIGPALRRGVDQALRINATGSAVTVRSQLSEIISKYQPDEVILTGQIHDQEARKRSFTIAAEAFAREVVAD